MINVSIIGASGYVGGELTRILLGHPSVRLRCLTSRSHSENSIEELFPNLRGIQGIYFEDMDLDKIISVSDVVFTALPYGASMEVVEGLISRGIRVIDMGADFRIDDPQEYARWYKTEHTCPFLLKDAVYGLPELNRNKIRNTRLLANPGCYPTSVLLGTAPLLKAGLVGLDDIIIDSKSGVSGAGRTLASGLHFSEVNENMKAYSISGGHRHIPEIQQEMGKLSGRKQPVITFTPHLIPVTRGILSTIYLKLKQTHTTSDLIDIYKEFYKNEPFIRVIDEGYLPEIKGVAGTNFCDIGLKVDTRTNRVTVVSVIDNLVKGAAGQGVQNMNLMFGLPEDSGLNSVSLYP